MIGEEAHPRLGMGAQVSVADFFGFTKDAAVETRAVLSVDNACVRWEGWGCSLGWLGKALGSSQEAEAWADLLFTTGDIQVNRLMPRHAGRYMQRTIPGLGFNIARYNVGGCGRGDDPFGELRSPKSRGWFAEIEGFLPKQSDEFDWSRDKEQRRFLDLGVARGVDTVELYHNGPMWWMTDSSSSFGGNLARHTDFVSYIAAVAVHARGVWRWPVRSIAPFNEPSAGWWNYPKDQEGCNIDCEGQQRVVRQLRAELKRQNCDSVLVIAASDENQVSTAFRTWAEFTTSGLQDSIGRVNVHSYIGLNPMREKECPGQRAALSHSTSSFGMPLWVSEHGTGDTEGLELAETILEDIHYLRPSAWCYWQPVEHHCSWGFVEADFGGPPAPTDEPRAMPALALPHPKHYVFAHFSHFIRLGCTVLHCSQPWAVAAFCPVRGALVLVLLNVGTAKAQFRLAVPSTFQVGEISSNDDGRFRLEAVLTQPQERRFFVHCDAYFEKEGSAESPEVAVDMDAASVCSIIIPGSLHHPATLLPFT